MIIYMMLSAVFVWTCAVLLSHLCWPDHSLKCPARRRLLPHELRWQATMTRTVTSVDDCVRSFNVCWMHWQGFGTVWLLASPGCLNLCYGFKVSLLSAVRLASSAVLSSWRGLLSLTAWHLWPGQTRVKSWYPSTWTGCPMKRHSTSFSV